jgi:hypothetical protein
MPLGVINIYLSTLLTFFESQEVNILTSSLVEIMDHLRLVGSPPVQVPYVRQTGWEYDQLGFIGFPERKRLNTQEIIDSGTLSLETKHLESFVQAWLFFGLLSEFSIEDFRVNIDSFVKHTAHGQVITTIFLSQYLQAWHQKMLSFCNKPLIRLRLMRIDLVLKDAKSVVLQYCSSTDTKDSEWRINPIIAMSIMIFGETLRWAMSQLLDKVGSRVPGWMTDDDHGWGTSQLLVEKMKERRWCPHSIYMLQGLVKGSISGLYYASTFNNPPDYRPGQDHRRCNFSQCVANDICEKYTSLHANAGCTCTPLEVDVGQIVAILETGDIALLRYDEGPEGRKFDVFRYELGMKFVVISHVWSDGLGNSRSNSVPSCQIARLNKLVAKFADFHGHEVFFWMDTLMIPVRQENKKHRKIAIRQMFDIYSAAQWTIVLDADLNNNNAGSDYLESAMRITISGWMRRLWTYQEGVMSKSIFFLFKDGLKDIEDLELMYPQAASTSSVAPAARSFYLNLIRHRAHQRHADIALASSIWKAIQWRRTYHPSDETLAIARILNVDEYLLRRTDSEERMEVLLKNMHEIPPGMIFLPGRRLSTEGVRWAPESWMVGHELEYPDPLSLPCKQYTFPQGYNIKVSHSLLTAGGLMVRYPGFRLHNFIKIPEHIPLCFPADSSLQQWYNVEYIPDSQGIIEFWKDLSESDKTMGFAIICCRPRPSAIAEIALLVLVKKEDGEALLVRWLLRVFIKLEVRNKHLEVDRQAFKQDFSKFCWGEELSPDQLWVVD